MSTEFRRPDLIVVVRVLEALWKHPGPVRPTTIQRASGLNYERLMRYLELFVTRGLVEVSTDEAGNLYALTQKGYETLRDLANGIRKLVEE
jgi:predicted transcriptional regulator